jgi:hypothetical protein
MSASTQTCNRKWLVILQDISTTARFVHGTIYCCLQVAFFQQGKMRAMALPALLFAVAVAQLHQSQAQETSTQGE